MRKFFPILALIGAILIMVISPQEAKATLDGKFVGSTNAVVTSAAPAIQAQMSDLATVVINTNSSTTISGTQAALTKNEVQATAANSLAVLTNDAMTTMTANDTETALSTNIYAAAYTRPGASAPEVTTLKCPTITTTSSFAVSAGGYIVNAQIIRV